MKIDVNFAFSVDDSTRVVCNLALSMTNGIGKNTIFSVVATNVNLL